MLLGKRLTEIDPEANSRVHYFQNQETGVTISLQLEEVDMVLRAYRPDDGSMFLIMDVPPALQPCRETHTAQEMAILLYEAVAGYPGNG